MWEGLVLIIWLCDKVEKNDEFTETQKKGKKGRFSWASESTDF